MCSRKDVAAIDGAILAGESIASVARRTDIPRRTLGTHWKRCRANGLRMPKIQETNPAPVLPTASELELPALPESLPADHPVVAAIRGIQALHTDALAMYRAAIESRDYRGAVQFITPLRQNIKAVAELSMDVREENTFDAVRDGILTDFRDAIAAALEGLPVTATAADARLAIAEAFGRRSEAA